MKSFFLGVLLFLSSQSLVWAQQYTLQGTTRDAISSEALPFVSILVNGGPNGTTSNIDGKFQLKSKEPIRQLTFSYLGYEARKIEITGPGTFMNVQLKPAETSLQEVTVRANYNPAHRIIKLATQNRKNNDPARLAYYTYRVYTKTVATFEPGKVNLNDTLGLEKLTSAPNRKADSTDREMDAFFSNNYLFLAESIADHAFLKPDLDKETVLATRVSGLQHPTFALLSTDSKAFSVYQDLVNFFGKTFLSPISEGSTRKYDFRLEDTTYAGSDTIFIISYQPLPNKNFEGLKGQLHISSSGWAVENIIAESNEEEQQGVRLQQHYEKIGGQKWFPVQVTTDYAIKSILLNGRKPVAFTRSYYSNINLNPELKRRDFKAVTVKMNSDAHKQPETFWSQYRPDSLTAHEKRTYHTLDSLGRKANLDAKFRIMEAVFSKQLPLGPVSVDLNQLAKLNRYEGVRLGLGLHTNEKISGFFSLGGYAAYGFRDKALKYGTDLSFNLYKPNNLKLVLAHSEDVQESGGTTLPFYNSPLISTNLRPFVIRNMDKVTHQSAFVTFRTLKYLDLQAGLQQENKRSTNGYNYQVSADNFRGNFHFTEAVLGGRYAFREQVLQMFNHNISMGTTYPVVWFQYRRSLTDVLNGEFAYHKYNFRLEKTFRQKALGSTKVNLVAGLVQGSAPATNLFNGNGAFDSGYRVYTGEGFQTMAPDEFLSDRYAALYLYHNFDKLLYKSKHFSPALVAVTNIGYGSLQQPERHRNFAFKTMEKGFYESGLLVNDLLKANFSSIGLGVFYRYGAYQKPEPIDNFNLKLTAALKF